MTLRIFAINTPRLFSRRRAVLAAALLGLSTVLAPVSAATLADGMAAFEADDYQRAAGILKPLAEKGDVTAQFTLGYLYYMGVGVPQDKSKAATWYRKAADQQDPTALYNLGYLYLYGEGVKENRGKAIELFRQAAEKGQLLAMLGLGLIYETAKHSSPDYTRALEWYKRAAREGLQAAEPEVTRLQGWMKDRLRTVKGDDINLRASNNTGAKVLTKLSQPQRFYELRREGDWVQIQLVKSPRTQGWLHKDFVLRAK